MVRIVIIGGWPAGMMTAASILEHSHEEDIQIDLLEANSGLGKKLLISGGWRCNITTGNTDKALLATKYTRGWEFFQKSLWAFHPKTCRQWFESHGVKTKCEDDARVFPVSDNGKDVLHVFERHFQEESRRIRIHTKQKVIQVETNPAPSWEGFCIHTKNHTYHADILAIATGGNAYRHTGSTGDGYNFAESLWHTITPLWPSLSSFLLQESDWKMLSGITLPHAAIIDDQTCLSGSLLFTHFGISGPLAFMLSSHLAWKDITNLPIRFRPLSSMDKNAWNDALMHRFQESPKKKILALLKEYLPASLSDLYVQKYFYTIRDRHVGELSKHDREYIANILWNGVVMTLWSRRPGDEFVTAWGIETDALSPKTLESKIHKNLYFVGEILNIDGYTGGYSLQICWSTGYVAGRAIAKSIRT